MFGKLLPTRLAATSSPAPQFQFQLEPHTKTASKRPSSVFKKLLHVKNVFNRTSSAKKDANSQGTSQRRQDVPAPPQPSQGLTTLTYDDHSRPRPYLRSPVEPTRSPASLNLSPRFQTGWQSSISSTAPHSTLSARNSPLLAPPQSIATTSVTSFAPTRSTESAAPRSKISPKTSSPLAPPRSVATTPVAEPSPTSQCSKPSSSLLPASPIVAELERTTAITHPQSNDSARGVHSTIQDNIPPQLVDESDPAKKKLDALRKQIFAVDKDCLQLEKQLHEECDKFDKAKVALKDARSHRDKTDREYAALQVERRNLQLGQLAGDKWRPLGTEASQRYFAPSQPVAGQEKKKRGASLTASKSSRRAKVVIKSWDSRWASLMVPERYSVARTVEDTQIGAESVQEDSRLESDGLQSAKSAALNPSHWMTQGLLDGPDKKASHASTPQGPVATFNESGRETNDQRVRDAHQVDTSDYNGRPLRRSQLAPGSPIRTQQYNARSSKYA